MGRTEDIITRVRDIIGDRNKERWTDESLLRRLNEGQYDIAKKADLFRAAYSIQLLKGQYEYTLPENVIRIKEVLFGQRPLPIVSAQQMVRLYGENWRMNATTNMPVSIVTDRQNSRVIRVYPRPFIDSLYDSAILSPDVYGLEDIITGYTADSNFGIVGSIFDLEILDTNVDLYGIIVEALEGLFLTVEYVRRPIKLTLLTEKPEIPDAFDTALVRYIAGTALRDDIDAQNRSMGNEELILYRNELDDIETVGKQSGTSIAHNNTSEYRGMG